ncbi:MAG TPA: hypothetical protein PKN62_02020 [bacterium]|nr:hypothetical protein [bacterium]
MAENALALDKTWQNQDISSLLRQKKADQLRQKTDSARLKSQLANRSNLVNSIPQKPENISSELRTAKTASRIADEPVEQEDKQTQPTGEQVVDQAVNLAAQKASGEFLKTLWINIVDTCGLTFIVINFYIIIGFFEGYKRLCKPGDEWGDMKKVSGFNNLLEFLAIFVLDFLIFIIILLALSLLVIIVEALTNPLELMETVWELFKDAKDILIN